MSQNTPSSESPTHPDAPRAGGETPRWLEALDDAIGTADAEANDVTQKARFRSAGRDTAAALRELRASLLERPAPSGDRELPDMLRRFGRGAKRRGVTSDLNEDARWFAELHAFLDMAALEIESLRASLLERHRDGERERFEARVGRMTLAGELRVHRASVTPGHFVARHVPSSIDACELSAELAIRAVLRELDAAMSASPDPERASK